MKVIVVGAGIVGAACAHELAGRGVDVTVVEAAFCGGGATAAGMGHLVVMDDSPAQFALTQLSVALWRALAPDLTSAEFDPCGTLWVAGNGDEMAAAELKARAYQELGVEAQAVTAQELRRLEPHLRDGLAGGMRVSGDAVIYPTNAARWLLQRAAARGAGLLEVAKVTSIAGGEVLTAEGRKLQADAVVNAAGINAAHLTPGIPIVPRKGHLAITDRYPGMVRHQVLELGYLKSAHATEGPSVAFNVQPRKTGQLLIGSSREYVGLDESINHPLLRQMLERATNVMPGLARCNVLRVWTGFRPATPDKLPLIGEYEPGVWLAAGHEGLGITTSLGTARLLVDQLLNQNPQINPSPYCARRFQSIL
ncbi:MAG: NAD(P)/FAD-dependent oxidoreductase [Fimbriimonadaceae bacterium]